MSLTGTFNPATLPTVEAGKPQKDKKKKAPPFSLWLSPADRARLAMEAAGAPLGVYIKEKLFAGEPVRRRQAGNAIQDRQALAQVLAMLGRSRIASNLNQLAHAVNVGVLPVTPETEDELLGALRDVRAMRRLLLTALGLKPEGTL